ncbi:enoyl-CoA hydratase/isomerase family protein [Piscinibacter sp. XHJ-5]|uniref:enoyl-CoA hydratase/isomerase family protein n=1 Tax=Piscinibacter sp. XHJ-5 TaxID=3037797 RepID=UPI002452F24D|nr:enoyl-CoA hydratase/isomerase family protein [Piscinibacter sp. XHJ-5]
MEPKTSDRPSDMTPLTREGAVAVIRLSYPARRNAFGMQMRTQLRDRLREAMADEALRAIVITGEGGHFCAGGDISEMAQRSLLQNRERWNVVVDLIRLIATGPKPVVTAVEGSAMGAGFSIAALGDYLVCARDAKFGAAFARMGLMPDMGALWSLQHRVGRAKAREILGLARPFDGAEACRIGLANELCEPGQALERGIAVASEYAALPPVTSALLKSTLAQGVDSLEAAIRSETEFQAVAMGTADHHEAVRAFMEKRSPRFEGA